MYARQQIPEPVRRLAGLQAGVIAREQALGCGLGRHAIDRLVGDGQWCRMASGLYLISPGPPPWPSWAWAGVLAGGDFARLGGRAAGHMWGLCEQPPDRIQVLIRHESGVPGRVGPWSFSRERPGVRDPRSLGDPPSVRLEDATVDLASAGEPSEVVGWLTKAVQSRRTSPARLAATVRRRRRVRHRRLMLRVLGDVGQGAHSALEIDYLHSVERAHQLPRGERQVRRGHTWADVLYRAYGLLIELDGRVGHDGTDRFRDMRRDNAATLDGLITLRLGWSDVQGRPCEVAQQVSEVLVRRGWGGLPTRCPNCRLLP